MRLLLDLVKPEEKFQRVNSRETTPLLLVLGGPPRTCEWEEEEI